MNVLKGITSRKVRQRHFPIVEEMLGGKHFWSRSYILATAGGVTIDVLKQYVQNQPVGKRKRGRPLTQPAALYPPPEDGGLAAV